jgi:hypothetical protein
MARPSKELKKRPLRLLAPTPLEPTERRRGELEVADTDVATLQRQSTEPTHSCRFELR